MQRGGNWGKQGEAGLAALEIQPRVIREVFMQRIPDAWLKGKSWATEGDGTNSTGALYGFRI